MGISLDAGFVHCLVAFGKADSSTRILLGGASNAGAFGLQRVDLVD